MSRLDVVKSCFEAFRLKDRAMIERALAPDFSFTSPYDDHIGRDVYFERCWPNADRISEHVIETMIESGDEVIVRYLCRTVDGKEFRNVETFVVRHGKVHAIDVYFGAAWRDGTFLPQK